MFSPAVFRVGVRDARPDAEPDGLWTAQVEKVRSLKRPDWPIWAALPEGEPVFFIDLNGKKSNVMADPDNRFCKIVGDPMKHALLTAREEGIFQSLARTDNCELGVENMHGFYGWPKSKDRGKENRV